MDTNPLADKLVRVVVLLPPELVAQANALAENDRRYWMFGKPSRAAVVRAAMSSFFETGGSIQNQSNNMGTEAA